jgi:hypothetical protein
LQFGRAGDSLRIACSLFFRLPVKRKFGDAVKSKTETAMANDLQDDLPEPDVPARTGRACQNRTCLIQSNRRAGKKEACRTNSTGLIQLILAFS